MGKLRQTWLLAALVVLLFAAFSRLHRADAAEADCFETAKGRTVSWNAPWGVPTGDQDVEYTVTSVRVRNVENDRSVTLELSTEHSAQVKQRSLLIRTDEGARSFCERLFNSNNSNRRLALPGENQAAAETISSEGLPFIQYSREGWVRGKTPKNKRMAICKVLNRDYACLDEERQRWGKALTLVEEELSVGVK